ncbi:aldehyde dehydrogenase family protein [Hydrogenophaga sp.]|uniref:aldehyde dehydrogenase family protein n=1 Tax=Hydrogenophaga sp. TaxID=1904254 RepID=UPI002C372763|nr:aldehyde dehydrogenase family protein [Hydrogenophaga sp.]HMP09497.1 aldehyde dehydrogenase family protein [Hydrogenophaga sp.]
MQHDIDADLSAIQEARNLVQRARKAAAAFARIETADAWRIAMAVCRACEARAEHYARLAVEETGIGRVQDKVFKNLLASRDLMGFHARTRLGGLHVDKERSMVLVGRPAGVVMGLVASTSPIGTLYFKILSCLMTRNALILSPHPLAQRCSTEAVEYLRRVATDAGAPADAIQIQLQPTLEATHAMMRDPGVDVILATGGGPMVRAAYSSGNPALGVGPGNVPVYVDRSADLELAVHELMRSKVFDHGSACSAPSAVFVHQDVESEFRSQLQRAGAFFCDERQQQQLEAHVFPGGRLNPLIVGRSAATIAAGAGLGNIGNAEVLVGTLGNVHPKAVMAKEKLSTVLGYKCVTSREQAICDAQAMLAISGAGHTSGIFADDAETILLWGSALDVNRTVVNKGSSMGVIGDGTALAPTFTIGTGFAGRSSIGENVGPEHLINWKRIAFPLMASKQQETHMSDVRSVVRAVLANALQTKDLMA